MNSLLPLSHTETPADESQVSALIQDAVAADHAVYPIGGGTSLLMGTLPQQPGVGLATTGLNRVIDYPAADMTITVEAGITMAELQRMLAAESQLLPIDVPDADRATLGGLIATNHSGPRRFGYGTLRDYVIGIRAVNGRGEAFAAGGRVVKNVAGYDFCKLLTGSMGTLGVITQVTLKLKPQPAAAAMLARPIRLSSEWPDGDESPLESSLAALVHSQTTPTSVDCVCGPTWAQWLADTGDVPASDSEQLAWLLVGFEGTESEVKWQAGQLADEWSGDDQLMTFSWTGEQHERRLQDLIQFSADANAGLVAKVVVTPSGVVPMMQAVRQFGPVDVFAHAGNGILIAKFTAIPDDGVATVMNRLRTAAGRYNGSATVLSCPAGGAELTRNCVWGPHDAPHALLQRVQQAFDPQAILNPGRFTH